MSKSKPTPRGRGKKNPAVSLIRSSAAEYLTFVAASGQGGVEAVYADENVWLTQKMMGLLYDVDVRTISYHLKNIFADHELEENSVIQFFRITAADGMTYDTQHRQMEGFAMHDETNKGTKRTPPRDERRPPSRAFLPTVPETQGFIPAHGGYEQLHSFQKARIV